MGSKKIHVTWWLATAGPSESDATHRIMIMLKPRAMTIRAWPMTFTDGAFHYTGEMARHPDKAGQVMFNGEWTNGTAILLSWGLVKKTSHTQHDGRGKIRELEEISNETSQTNEGWVCTRNLRAHSLHKWAEIQIAGPPALSKADASDAWWTKFNKDFNGSIKVNQLPSDAVVQMTKDVNEIFDIGDSVFG